MPSSYSPTRGLDRDRAREMLGDTAVQPSTTLILDDDALHGDPHYDAVLGRLGFALGVSYLAHELWARFAQDPIKLSSQGDALDFSAQLDVWKKLAEAWLKQLQKDAATAASGQAAGRVARIGQITAGAEHQLR